MLLFLFLLGADVGKCPLAATKLGRATGPPYTLAARVRRQVLLVQRQVNLIQRQRPRLRPLRPDPTQPGPEGNDLVGYFAGSALRLVHQVNAGDSGEQQTDYYFAAGHLLFVYRRETRYPAPGQPDSSPTRTWQRRYYFEQDRLFWWSGSPGRFYQLSTAAARARQRALLAEAQALRQQLAAATPTHAPAPR